MLHRIKLFCQRKQKWVVSVTLAALSSLAVTPAPAGFEDESGDFPGLGFARGFSNQTESGFTDNIDTIDNFSGSLTLTIPLGESYAAGGNLSYGFTAFYNSHIFDVRSRTFDPPSEPESTVTVKVPSAYSNAGMGWSMHLGRLIEPMEPSNEDGTLERDQQPVPEPNAWRYVSPDGSVHHFGTGTLPSQSGGGEANVGLHGEGGVANVYYARDGSYLRMKTPPLTPANTVTVEMADGNIHKFEKRASWPDSNFNRDQWRLVEIRDRSGNLPGAASDNVIVIEYFSDRWEVTDRYGRTQKVYYEADPWYGGRIKKVELTTFGGTTSEYTFRYTTRNFFHTEEDGDTTTVQSVGVLTSIERPDTAEYSFTFVNTEGLQRIASAQLPSGGSIVWRYGAIVLYGARSCNVNSETPTPQFFVKERIAKESADGAELKRTFYLRETVEGTDIEGTCFGTKPDAELITARIDQYNDSRARASLFYFSIWPVGENHWNFPAGGWKGEDYGLPITHNRPGSNQELLSSEIYDCTYVEPDFTDKPLAWTEEANCIKKRSNFKKFIADFSACGVNGAQWHCTDRNAIVQRSTTKFHDDNGKSVSVSNVNNDGFGHWRKTTQLGNISTQDTRVTRKIYNASRGILRLNADGTIANNSTWTNYPVNAPWILTNFSNSRVEKDGQVFREQVCFHHNTPFLKRVRTRSSTSGTSDSTNDLVRIYSYGTGGSSGLPIRIDYFGGDTQSVAKGVGCNYNFGAPRYSTVQTYQKGVLKTARHAGSTVYTVNIETIDANTGLPKKVWDPTGNVSTTASYDNLGRLISTAESTGSNTTTVYQTPGVGNYTGATPTITRTTKIGNSTQDYRTVRLDGIGRINWIDQPYKHGIMRTQFSYTPDSRVAWRTVPQKRKNFRIQFRTEFDYDLFGRVTKTTYSDGSVNSSSYTGIRKRTDTVSVGTIETATGVNETDAETTYDFDQFGNVLKITAPETGVTTFSYNALGQLVSSTRGVQTRTFTYDSRGLLLSETQPESGTRTYSDYDALGNIGEYDANGTGGLIYTYDSNARLTEITERTPLTSGGPIFIERLFASYTYGTSGTDNGRITESKRYNYLTTENTGDFLDDGGTFEVKNIFSYGAQGAPRSRKTTVTQITESENILIGSFHQSWNYDQLGRVSTVSYPTCKFPCSSPSRTVTVQYASGGALSRVLTNDALGAIFYYHINGARNKIRHDNGADDINGIGAGRVQRPSSMSLAGDQMNLGAYKYDDAGNVTKIGSEKFIYDLESRIKKAYLPGGSATDFESFSYDNYNNLTFMGWTPILDTATNQFANAPGSSTFTYDPAGRLSKAGPDKFHYDRSNLPTTHIREFSRNFDQACNVPGGTGECTFFFYGPAGARVATVKIRDDQSVVFRWTLRDLDGTILRTFDGAQNLPGPALRPTKEFVYALGTPLASKDMVTGQRLHLHVDHLGSVRAATDPTTGTLIASYNYQAFGLEANGTGTVSNDVVGWIGSEINLEGFYQVLGSRVYSPAHRRFFTPDLVNDGWNLYTYARNNPLNRIDPSGLQSEDCNDVARPAVDGGLTVIQAPGQCTNDPESLEPGDFYVDEDGNIIRIDDNVDVVGLDPDTEKDKEPEETIAIFPASTTFIRSDTRTPLERKIGVLRFRVLLGLQALDDEDLQGFAAEEDIRRKKAAERALRALERILRRLTGVSPYPQLPGLPREGPAIPPAEAVRLEHELERFLRESNKRFRNAERNRVRNRTSKGRK